MGEKKIFYSDCTGKMAEINLTCALDFYVHESAQRGGHGKAIYDYMLLAEGLEPTDIAIDRPSFKFLGFMKKYFGLAKFIPQSSHFVIFDQFFDKNKRDPRTKAINAVNKGKTLKITQSAQDNPAQNKGFLNVANNILNRENIVKNNVQKRSICEQSDAQ